MKVAGRLGAVLLLWSASWQPASAQAPGSGCPCSLFGSTAPGTADAGADSPVELGVRFVPSIDGYVTAIRFYKSAANVGPHTGRLWSAGGVELGAVTFGEETTTGWQEARLAHPVFVTAGTPYVASYSAPTGHYAFSSGFFSQPHVSGPLSAPSGTSSPNGVFDYPAGRFPRSSYRSANYWVDVVFETLSQTGPEVTATRPSDGATDAVPPIAASFGADMDGSTIVMSLRAADGTVVAGSTSYEALNRTATFTPSATLRARTTYTATVESARDTLGRPLLASFAWSFTTGDAGFRELVVWSNLTQPMSVRFAPDGAVFVAEKSGIIKVFESLADPTPAIFADLRTQVFNFWDRGLMGLAVHPQFPAEPYVYVAYAYDAPVGGTAPVWGTPGATSDTCPNPPGAMADGCVVGGRVSRLRAAAAPGGYVMTAEEVLIEDWGQQYPSHSIGGLEFGPDGALYVSGGDGASFNFADYGQKGSPPNPLGDTPVPLGVTQTLPDAEGGALRSLSLRRAAGGPALLNGTVVRVDPVTGAGLPTNPLGASADPNARRIIAQGLRNPFRFTFRPGTSEVWLGDVGWNDWEEINRIPDTGAVANFGWPCYEGGGRQGAYEGAGLTLCRGLYAETGSVSAPYFAYHHLAHVVTGETCGTGSSSISGIAFYDGGSYPADYAGALFFADYSRRCIWVMFRGANGLPDPGRRATFAPGAAGPVELGVGPGGDLFYVDLGGGTIRRISYVALESDAPSAWLAATPTSGGAPLTVTFDASGTTGGAAGGLVYDWDFGDGETVAGGAAVTSHTYTAGGVFVARVTARDSVGATGSTELLINVDNTAPTAIIDAPLSTLRWRVGQNVTFSGRATDAEEGTLAAEQLQWSLVMFHCSDATTCHQHPIQTYAGVAGGTFAAPDHEYPSYLMLSLTAQDGGGLTSTASVRLDPEVVTLTFETAPPGLSLAVGSSTSVAPFTRTVIAGSTTSVSAPGPQTLGGTAYGFSSWSNGGAQAQLIVASADTTYLATYAPATAACPCSLFQPGDTPQKADAGADDPVELGVKFYADADAVVLGVRFYKSAANTGPHVGSLWTLSGTRLAEVTFTGETSAGWQEARFAAPVAIAAGTTYVVSYHTTVGHYAHSGAFFTARHDSGVLHAPASSASPNGVFRYGPAGSFPTGSYNASNYWVDMVVAGAGTPDSTAPSVTARTPAAGSVDVPGSQAVQAVFSEAMDPASITAASMTVRDSGGAAVPGTVSYAAAALTATFVPNAPLPASSQFTVHLLGAPAPAALKDAAGNALAADDTWSFRTAAPSADGCPCTLWPPSQVPVIGDAGPDSPVTLGVRFRSAVAGRVLGVRFYKSAANAGPHVGSLWSSSGTRLAEVTFTAETASGWQEASFSSPVAIAAGGTYVVSYHAPAGHYALTTGYFESAWTRGPLTAPSSSVEANGVFSYGAPDDFPVNSFDGSNYWVDVVFSDAPDTEPPAVAAATPPSNATDVPLAPSITVRFTEGMDPATINTQTFELRSAGGAVAGEVTYDAAALTARLTPAAPLAPGTRYTVQVAGGAGAAVMRDVAGNALAGDVSWDFDTTTVTTTCPCTLWPPDAVPAVVDAGPDGSVELGVRFSSVENGFIRGIRFYKSAGNLGPHVVSLWTAGGALLAQATSSVETASGWQEVAFDVPVAITSGLTYVASYHVSGGHYSYSSQYFTSPRSRGPLLAPAASAGGNGVFAYGASSLFPTGTHNATNYWVDVVFSRD